MFGNPTELRPFIKSAAYAGEWEQALDLTKTANRSGYKNNSDYFENLWRIIDRDLPDTPEKTETVNRVYAYLEEGK